MRGCIAQEAARFLWELGIARVLCAGFLLACSGVRLVGDPRGRLSSP